MQDWLISYFARFDWPVLTLEMRRAKRSERSFIQMLWAAIGLTLICMAVMVNDSMSYDHSYYIHSTRSSIFVFLAGALRIIYVLFVVPAYSSRTIAAEREMQRFENLAMTPLTSVEIIVQKAVLPMLYALAINAALLPLDLYVWSSSEYAPLSFAGPIYFVLQTALYTGIGVLCSCMCARARTASAATYGIILVAPMVFGMLWSMLLLPFMLGFGRGSLPSGEQDVLSILFSGLGGVATCTGITLLCLFLATRKLESLRHAV